MTVQLTPEQEAYVHAKVSAGRYSSSRDVIDAGLRLLEEQEESPMSAPFDEPDVTNEARESESDDKFQAGLRYLAELSKRYREEGPVKPPVLSEAEWAKFVNETYGSLADDPIERLPQGDYPVLDPIL